MISAVGQGMNACLFGLALTVLLFSFAPRQASLSKMQTIGICCAAAVLLSLTQLTASWQNFMYYPHVLLVYCVSSALLWLWTGWDWRAAFQRAVSWYLITEYNLLLFSFFSQRMWGEDLFRSLPVWRMALSCMGLTLISFGVLFLVRHIFPASVKASGSTLSMCLLSMEPYLFVRQITLWLPVRVEDVTFAVVIMLALSVLLSLILSISLERLLNAENEKRRAMARQMDAERLQQQYILRKNSIDAVRQQYHDMKNLLLYLEKAPSTQNVHAHLDKMLRSIQPFETVLDTGNDAVDILLGEKLEACRKQNIPCTVMADGALLSFIDQLDLVTILGNAMDNAMEACRHVPVPDRLIQVRTAEARGFAVLHIHNSCSEEISVHGSIPPTTKRDGENHGFGLSNIQRVMKSYGGEVRCEAQGGEFTLTLLFPRQAQPGR